MNIRPARTDEHVALSRIAYESKAHWGYPATDLARWRAELTITPESLAQRATSVAEIDGRIAGFCQWAVTRKGAELEHFWVHPDQMGQGVGRALLAQVLREVRSGGHDRLHIDADPNAEGFYRSCGARRIGEVPAPTAGDPDRVRPQLVLDLDDGTAGKVVRLCVLGLVLPALLLLSIPGCRPQPDLAPFSSDGCSLFPDAALITEDDWCTCCVEHDMAYWRGGTADEREQADRALQRCVLDKTQNDALATLMYEGVRVGGSPYFYNWYRWGYGWPFDRKYQPLTDAEHSRADDLLADYVADDSGDVCR